MNENDPGSEPRDPVFIVCGSPVTHLAEAHVHVWMRSRGSVKAVSVGAKSTRSIRCGGH